MKPVSKVNTATEDNKNQDQNSSNSALSRTESNRQTLGADAEFDEKVEGYGDRVAKIGHRAQEMATDFAGRAQEYGNKAIEETGSFVRSHPGPTLLAGFGAGILVGVAIARR